MRMQNKSIRTNRHIVVFESDDWGTVRLPSLKIREDLLKKGIRLSMPDTYDKFDTLASNDDLTAFMEVLVKVKDRNGNPAKITFNTVVANPDFDRIRESGYQTYYYEPFVKTLERYPRHDHSFNLWKEGIEKGVFQPQFHGREHLNVQLWMQCLREGLPDVLAAFDYGLFSVMAKGRKLMPAYNIATDYESGFVKNAIKEGMGLFVGLFGFTSLSTIAPSYTWDDYVERSALDEGVKVIQGEYRQKHSKACGNSQTWHYMGECNVLGQVYLTRNCYFEPTQSKKMDGAGCLRQIAKQFSAGRPAVVSCHRLNFIGDLVESNRTENLRDFGWMLRQIIKRWPDVEFMSSDEFGRILLNQ